MSKNKLQEKRTNYIFKLKKKSPEHSVLKGFKSNNQSGISKLNTDTRLAETIIIDRKSTEHTENKVN